MDDVSRARDAIHATGWRGDRDPGTGVEFADLVHAARSVTGFSHPRPSRPAITDVGWRLVCLMAALVAIPGPAMAHTNPGLASGFWSGVSHPLTGLDHVLAMVAVGIWGTQLGKPAI